MTQHPSSGVQYERQDTNIFLACFHFPMILVLTVHTFFMAFLVLSLTPFFLFNFLNYAEYYRAESVRNGEYIYPNESRYHGIVYQFSARL